MIEIGLGGHRIDTPSALADDWLAAQRSPQTADTYRAVITEYLAWCDRRATPAWAARRRDVDNFRHHLSRRGLGDVTVAKHLSALASFYRYAGEEGAIEHNPVANVKRPLVANEAHRDSLNLGEARALLAASIEDGPRTAALVHLLLSTGVRVSEAVNADIGELGWNPQRQRTLRVTRKSGRKQTIPIQPRYWDVIAVYLAERGELGPKDPLLAGTRGRMSRQTAWRIVSDLASGVVPHLAIGPHSLRHTAATLALSEGVPLQEVQGMLGHADSRTTARYDAEGSRRGGVALAALGAALAGKGEP